ncbi:Protein containing domains DUF403 [invertebrate metagenome]|uniref:Protein containing domains DUF403 n=1 Tax=invertebrate metagenome TaxID=1711999 RepID=A0A484H4X8_9ZZZZ
MLSRTADNLYWMARYVERAENMARLLDVSYRLSQLPRANDHSSAEWETALSITGQLPSFLARHDTITASNVIAFVALAPDNPSSIVSCLHQARENARAERGVIPSELFESLNAAWLELRETTYVKVVEMNFRAFFDWVKERSHLFRGVSVGTMVRGDGFRFNRLGTFVERADNTARLLDVKYDVLVHEAGEPMATLSSVQRQSESNGSSGVDIGDAVDYYQWGALLRSVSGFKAYRMLYRDTIRPQQVTELLIFRHEFPRSLHACYDDIQHVLERLCSHCECTRFTGEMHARLHFGRIRDIPDLHNYLTEFIDRNAALSDEIRRNFMMVF